MIVPNTAPMEVSVSRINGTHMNVTWVKLTLEEARGFVTGYTIRYDTIALRRRRAVRMEVVDQEDSYAVIGGLGFTESYSITVSASSTAGEGIASEPILVYGRNCIIITK